VSQGSEFPEKIDTLDLIITVLKDHEKILDNLAKRLTPIVKGLESRGIEEDRILENISSIERKISGLNDIIARFLLTQKPESAKGVLIECNNWEDFKTKSYDARTVTFDVVEKDFVVNSVSGNQFYKYSETLPENEFLLKKEGELFTVERISITSLQTNPLLFMNNLKCGLEIAVETSKHNLPEDKCLYRSSYKIIEDKTKEWLSQELNIPKDKVLRGKFTV
jgi:hypothetical protein